jgi:phytoene desaturase
MNVGVIGGGLAGLSSACVLAARGHQVTLFDKNPWLGGKAAILEEQGYHFDMGPTILTIPSVLRRVFAEANRKLEDYLELIHLDPQWRCFFQDRTVLDLFTNVETMAEKIETYAPGSGEGYRNFQKFATRMNSITEKFFFYRPVGGMGDMIDLKIGFKPSLLGDVMAMRMGRSVAGTVRKHIPDQRVAQMLDHFVQYIGSSPEKSPAVLCGIAHMQAAEGIWYPKGGTGAVPKALCKLAEELGVDLRPGVDIRKINTDSRGRIATGVETTTGESIPFDAVVSNCDSVRTHRELLGMELKASKKFLKKRTYEPACSGVVLYLGLKQKYDHILHHNFVFSRDPEEEFHAIYDRGEVAPDPTCYVCAPALTEPEVAPPGGEALYVLVHTPYLRPNHDWKKMLPEYRKTIIEKLKTTGGMPDLEERIAFEATLTPQDIHDRYRVLDGAIYGLASHGKWFGAFKPSNRSRYVQGLYLAGGAAHPGPGMPMVLMSGWIAADALDRDAQTLAPTPQRQLATSRA